MLIRLIIAVFGLVLVFALGSVALAGPGDNLTSYAEEPTRFIPNHPRLNDVEDARPVQPSFKKPASALRALPLGTPAAAPPSQSYFCDFQGYAGGPAFFWNLPDPYGDDLFNTRFTVEVNFECTLKVAHLLMYEPEFVGTPDMRVYLWDDDGFGFPGTVLDSVDIANATILAATGGSLGYVAADFSAAGWVFADGDEYHYGFTPLGGGLSILSDDGSGPSSGEERSSEFYLGAWGSMLNDWGKDYVFDIISERCCEEIPFSDCYTQTYAQNIAFFWRTPHPVFGDTSWSMRFSVGGPETLQSVDIAIFDHSGIVPEPVGDDPVTVTIYDDDGFGQPGVQLAQVTLAAGTYPFFPAYTNFSFTPLVLENSFHVAFSVVSTAGSYESTLSSDATDGVGRSNASGDPTWPGATTWYTMLEWWFADYNFLFDANLCRDEFNQCSIQDYGPNIDAIYPVPDGNPIIEWAQLFDAFGAECELRQLDLCFGRSGGFDVGDPTRDSMYTKNTNIHIRADAGGIPGAIVQTLVLTPADYAAAGFTGAGFSGLFFITLSGLNITVPAPFWVGIESQAAIRGEGIRVCLDIFGGEGLGKPVGLWGNIPGPGWLFIPSFFGWDNDAGMSLGAKVCCIPFDGRVCDSLPTDTWITQSHDFGRTGASQLSIDDAWCDLTTSWLYETPANLTQFAAPIVHDGRVYISTSSSAGNASTVEVLDLITGANLFTISDADFGNFILNDPTIVGDILYVSGGDLRTITAWDISGAPVKVMSRSFGGVVGPLRFANTIVLNIGGSDVIFAGSEVGRVVAIDAATGADYGGWAANPLTLTAGQRIGGSASDGVSLYYVTRIGGLNGDLFSVDATTGTINWQLSSAGGFQNVAVYGSESDAPISEGFTNVSYDAGKLFVGSRMTGDFPRDGVYYTLNANSGSVINAIATTGFIFSNPIVDINLVYLQTDSRWIGGNSVLGNNFIAANKNTGAKVWQSEDIYEKFDQGEFSGNGVLSCEPEPVADIIINTDSEGSINFWNSITGEQLFRRRWDYGQDVSDGAAVTLAVDNTGATHLLVSTLFGAVVDLVKGADRPRLEIQDYDPNIPVEFGVAISEIKTIPNAIVNTGCAALTFNAVNVDTVSNGSSDPFIVSTNPVRQELLDRSSDLANQLASSAYIFKGVEEANIGNYAGEPSLVSIRELAQNNERFIGRSATTSHPFLNSVDQPFSGQVLAGGDSLDIILDVSPANIERGPQVFYIELDTDDPDFYVNGSSAFLPNPFPEIRITLIGGCLTDTTYLEFGIGAAAAAPISNSVRMAEGDWSPTGVDYGDGFGGDLLFQGTYVFAVSTERIAMNVTSWQAGEGEAESWISVQGDPNWCDNACKPALITGVNLGDIWDAGMAMYVPIIGNMICVSWIDSVQDFSLFAGAGIDPDPLAWKWRHFGAPFDDSLTMGLTANTRTFGALDVAALAAVYVEIFEITERNGNSIPDWKLALDFDYDVAPIINGNADTAILDQSISAAWTTDAFNASGVDFAWGVIKLPFGCGYKPLKSCRLLDSSQGQFQSDSLIDRGNSFWDSAYTFMSLPDGSETSQGTGGADQQFMATIIEHDFGPNETLTFGIANFGLSSGVTDPSAAGGGGEISALADLVNKWVGFGRGDVDDDGIISLADIMVTVGIVSGSVPGAIPFEHLADVNGDGAVDAADVNYLVDYYFFHGPCPFGDWTL